jgi:hypothetical protein
MRIFAVLLMASVLLVSCGGKRTSMAACESEHTEAAAQVYFQRFNDERFEEIHADRTDGYKEVYPKEGTIASLKDLKAQYGRVTGRSLRHVTVEPSSEGECDASAVNALYNIEAEKGRYVQQLRWHIVEGQTKLATGLLYEYDENGKLYLTLKLRYGLGENDESNTKVRVE